MKPGETLAVALGAGPADPGCWWAQGRNQITGASAFEARLRFEQLEGDSPF